MTYLSCLADKTDDLIIDTSVFINLVGTGECAAILTAIPNRIFMPAEVYGELLTCPNKGRDDRAVADDEFARASIERLELFDETYSRYGELINHDELPLGDGEAATIALAEYSNAIAVIDENRARQFLSDQNLASSVDLISHPNVQEVLGPKASKQAVLNALVFSNMSVRIDQRAWIIDLIGQENISRCTSLPGYKRLIALLDCKAKAQHPNGDH